LGRSMGSADRSSMSSLLSHPVSVRDQWEMNTGDRFEGVRMSCEHCACHTMVLAEFPRTPRCMTCGSFDLILVPSSPAD
jgi:hypothetical protein